MVTWGWLPGGGYLGVVTRGWLLRVVTWRSRLACSSAEGEEDRKTDEVGSSLE